MRRVFSLVSLPAVLLLAAQLSGILACSPHKVIHNPAPPIVVPAAYRSIGAGGDNLPDRWWRDFHDPTLNRLVEEALQGNLQVRAAWERVTQAQQVAKQAGAARFPLLNLTGNYNKTKPSYPFQLSVPSSLQASYEVDFFKKASNSTAAAGLSALAARDQVESIAMSLVAQISETWFSLLTQQRRLALIKEQVSLSEQFLELAEMRLGQGLGSSLDVLQQRQQVAAVSGERVPVESSIVVLRNQLALLTGRPPSELALETAASLPTLPPHPASGIPADLLLRRPDVRAAQRLVEAADYGVAVAVASRLPGLRLSGNYGPFVRIGDTYSVLTIWSFVGDLLMPLFDRGRLKAEVSRNESVVRERSYDFGQALLQAIVEVENALAQESKELEYIGELEAQYVLSQEALDSARSRYADGLGNESFIQILSALSSTQQLEQAILSAKLQALSYRVQLCRALGGTWTQQIQRSEDDRSVNSIGVSETLADQTAITRSKR